MVLPQHVTSRWVFYISLSIAGAALFFMFPFLQVKHRKEATFKGKMRRVDWRENAILVASVVSIPLALTYGGIIFP